MRNSIFEIENRIDIVNEFKKIMKTLYHANVLIYDGRQMALYDFLDNYVFSYWKYRDTFMNVHEYMEHIGIPFTSNYSEALNEEVFLNLLEFLLNIWKVAKKVVDFKDITVVYNAQFDIVDHNIPLLLEKLNYKAVNIKDKVLIVKRDPDVDSVLDIVPKNISSLLLSYYDIRNNKITSKKKILKDLDLYIEENKKIYTGLNNPTYETIEAIINGLGINHPIHKEFEDMSIPELCNWYDKCFKAMIHLIRCEAINKINNERKKMFN